MPELRACDLHPGDAIDAGALGLLTVIEPPYIDLDTDTPSGQWTRVLVDVEVDRSNAGDPRWDCDHLPDATGAESFQFLRLMPLSYRLIFLPDDEVEVHDA